MAQRNLIVIAGAALVAACSGSTSSMLESGDPKICVSDDILSRVYEIVKQNAQVPRDDNLITVDYEKMKLKWIGKLVFSTDDVTSIAVDRDNQSVTCSGKLHISAEDTDDATDASFDFQVKANLSDDKNPIVSVDVSRLQGTLSSMLARVSKPDFDNAQSKRDETDDALTKQEEDLLRNTPGALKKLQDRSRDNIVQSVFTASELTMIDRIYLSHMMCMVSDARNRDAHCRKKVRLDKEANSNDLCSTAGDEWYHCSREHELQYQRDMLEEQNEENKPLFSQTNP